MAEVRQTVEESADLVRTVEYLRERESELSNYSDKLRESVERIANVFGDRDECQICGVGKSLSIDNCYNLCGEFSDFNDVVAKTRNHDEVVAELAKRGKLRGKPHKFIAKVEISIDVEGEEFTTSVGFEGMERAALCLDHHSLRLKSYTAGSADSPHYLRIKDLSREELKRVVKERRITELIEIVKQKLDETTEEYKQVSEMAERLASAL